jgi:hypothetical protein
MYPFIDWYIIRQADVKKIKWVLRELPGSPYVGAKPHFCAK